MHDQKQTIPNPVELQPPESPYEDFEIHNPLQFLNWLEVGIENAESRVEMNFMEVWLHEEILDRLYTTILTKRNNAPDLPISLAISKASIRNSVASVKFRELESFGVKIIWTNEEYLTHFQGNNHRKIVVIDDKCAIGGVNLHGEVLNALDYMIVFNSAPRLCEVLSDTITHYSGPDATAEPFNIYDLSENGTMFKLILENGKADRRSEIIEQAIHLISQAAEEVLVCGQWLPDDRMLFALIGAARRGVKIKLYTNFHKEVGGMIYSFATWFNQFTVKSWLRGVNIDFKNPDSPISISILPKRVHSKVMIVDGEVMVIGSENFVRSGAMFCTRESAIVTTCPQLVREMSSRLQADVNS